MRHYNQHQNTSPLHIIIIGIVEIEKSYDIRVIHLALQDASFSRYFPLSLLKQIWFVVFNIGSTLVHGILRIPTYFDKLDVKNLIRFQHELQHIR